MTFYLRTLSRVPGPRVIQWGKRSPWRDSIDAYSAISIFQSECAREIT